MVRAKSLFFLTGLLSVGACAVAPPSGPSIVALPPQGKSLAQFQQEDTTCRGYAQQAIGYGAAQQAANQSAATSAAAGTLLGAAAGAAIGAAASAPGIGAAVGAGTGLLAGTAVGANNAWASSADLQRRYDITYAQCMAASGNSLQQFAFAPPWPYGPDGYLYSGWGYYGPWLGSGVAVGFLGRFGPHFHHFHDHDDFEHFGHAEHFGHFHHG